jgi:hypothetical protein
VEVERRRNPYSYLLRIAIDDPKYDKKKKRMMRWQNLWVDQFTAIRNLYANAVEVLPRNKVRNDFWINNVHLDFSVEVQDYVPKTPPVLIHAPSEVGIKGSKYVEDAIRALREEGYEFKYIRVEKLPNREAHRIYREEADIIIDQFLVGGLGNLACEGMFYGRPVCSYLIDEFFDWYPDCPIVNCTIENLKEKLAWLIENPEVRREIGRRGRAFIKKHCDPEKINQKVWEMYLEVMDGK